VPQQSQLRAPQSDSRPDRTAYTVPYTVPHSQPHPGAFTVAHGAPDDQAAIAESLAHPDGNTYACAVADPDSFSYQCFDRLLRQWLDFRSSEHSRRRDGRMVVLRPR